MAATVTWEESNSAGQTITGSRTEVNWKNIDDSSTAYSSYPVATSTNSFEKWQNLKFAGTFNQILNGKFSHTAGAADTGITLKGQPAMTVDADRLTYTTPAIATNAALTFNDTAIVAIASGRAVWFGATSSNAAGKAASMTTNPCYSNYLTTQLQVGSSAVPGDMTTLTLTAQWDES